MKNYCIALALLASCMTSCQNDKISEVEQKRQALEAKRNELKEKQELVALETEMKKVEQDIDKVGGTATAVAYKSSNLSNKGRIVGVNVIMRSAASVQSTKLDNFVNNETVSILSRSGAAQGNEAVLNDDVQLYSYTSSGRTPMYTLPKGKAVVIQEYLPQNNSYRVSYQHPDMGKLEAAVQADLLQNISHQTWYQVQRNNGQTGWVLGQFLMEI